MEPKTLIDNIWDSHVVSQDQEAPAVLYIDLHLVHEVTSPQAFNNLRTRGIKARRPDRTFGTMDHSTPTKGLSLSFADDMASRQLQIFEQNCKDHQIRMYNLESEQRGIVHVIGPELGLTQPGKTIVCGDSHTSTHGAFGALAFGIGTSEVEHVLATQCLLQRRPKTFAVNFDGQLPQGVTAKDMILALIARIGVGGGTGHVFEYRGEAVRSLSMEARMTLCNMSIEGGARAGMIAPDETTIEYLAGREFAPQGAEWDTAVAAWTDLSSDAGATYDQEITIDVSALEPMITYGTNPGMGLPITGHVPDPMVETDANKRQSLQKALSYMELTPGQAMLGQPIDVVFVGSCTNSRISDLKAVAAAVKGRKIADNVRMLVVPGSEPIRHQAEAEGLHQIFVDAGAEWRFSGCSMCIAMNGDQLAPGQYAVSTSNRNFEGRQGKGGHTFLASPLTAAASALTGVVTDPRTLFG